jgi:hypothetical protein
MDRKAQEVQATPAHQPNNRLGYENYFCGKTHSRRRLSNVDSGSANTIDIIVKKNGDCDLAGHKHQRIEPRGLSRAAITARGMTGKEAAQFYGLSPSAFYKARKEGRIPRPTLPGRRYDRVLLENEMNRLSGINDAAPTNPLDEWRRRRGQGYPIIQ